MSDLPLIAVTTSEVRVASQVQVTPEGEPPRPEMALGMRYLEAIESVGGLPVVIPPLPQEDMEELIGRVSGVCLSGGPDIHPSAYGQDEDPALGPTWMDLDEAELAVARAAIEARVPILAICRGAQALNVARSGTLFQDLPSRFGTKVQHRRNGGELLNVSHPVEVKPDSLLARSLGTTQLEVNSFHHQASDQIGRGLRAVAWSPDGVVEGIEAPRRDFVVGVQWHAEAMEDEPAQRLFEAFIEACRVRDSGAPVPA
ncbi:MAG: gamma-glutamyl-gamma-aminobutyrate hydrolase family protein [Actinomycetota bacterium]|nr:gamma-glutamyl-gamma-aminobutyrate hydrolase family protein [Actinomycetota bacterium]